MIFDFGSPPVVPLCGVRTRARDRTRRRRRPRRRRGAPPRALHSSVHFAQRQRARSSRTAPTGERFRGEFSNFQGLLDVARIDSFNHDVDVDDDVVVGDDWRACGAP